VLDAHRPDHQFCCHRSVGSQLSCVSLDRSPAPFGSVLGGGFADKYVPKNIRDLLIAESASNDGLAYPFLSISIYLTTEASRATAVGKWIVIGCFCAQNIYHQEVLIAYDAYLQIK
jgi:hypothetical protein